MIKCQQPFDLEWILESKMVLILLLEPPYGNLIQKNQKYVKGNINLVIYQTKLIC